jgi:hypothetical protein
MEETKKVVLGPEGFNKIALLGTASSSMALAPFKDLSWAIWACSPGTYPICAQNRSDVWFEPHRWLPTAPGQFGAPGTKPWFSPEFHTFLSEHKGPVFMSKVQESIPMSMRIPFEQLIEKYGPYCWTSTIAYMIAIAIDVLAPRAANGEKVAIGLWGIDMAATEEWSYQRPGCQHFIGLAQSLGIEIVLPAESDLMRPPTMYGIGELNPRHIRLSSRKVEVEAQIAQLTAQHDELIKRTMLLKGALGELDYMLGAWSDDIRPDMKHAVSFAQEYARPVGALSAEIKQVVEKEKPATTGADVQDFPDAKNKTGT